MCFEDLESYVYHLPAVELLFRFTNTYLKNGKNQIFMCWTVTGNDLGSDGLGCKVTKVVSGLAPLTSPLMYSTCSSEFICCTFMSNENGSTLSNQSIYSPIRQLRIELYDQL
jgi:hypothetical protein